MINLETLDTKQARPVNVDTEYKTEIGKKVKGCIEYHPDGL